MDTTYLDVVYLHDIEMVAEEVMPKRDGDHSTALGDDMEAYGLSPGQEGEVRGEGDRKVLEAYGELQKLKEEGLVKNIGITGIIIGCIEWGGRKRQRGVRYSQLSGTRKLKL